MTRPVYQKCTAIAPTTGNRCNRDEIEGLEFCIMHVPDEYLDEAEEVTGFRRCRRNFGSPDACKRLAIRGTEPAACQLHAGHKTQAKIGLAKDMADRAAAILGESGERLLHPEDIADPLTELLTLAAEVKAVKELLRGKVAPLFDQDQLRYTHGKAGEQLRMEILLYERGLDRLGKILLDISKLKIDERLTGIRQQTADMLERAVDAALEKSGIGLDGKGKAREELRRHLKVVA